MILRSGLRGVKRAELVAVPSITTDSRTAASSSTTKCYDAELRGALEHGDR